MQPLLRLKARCALMFFACSTVICSSACAVLLLRELLVFGLLLLKKHEELRFIPSHHGNAGTENYLTQNSGSLFIRPVDGADMPFDDQVCLGCEYLQVSRSV
jgi:hypothetical protein